MQRFLASFSVLVSIKSALDQRAFSTHCLCIHYHLSSYLFSCLAFTNPYPQSHTGPINFFHKPTLAQSCSIWSVHASRRGHSPREIKHTGSGREFNPTEYPIFAALDQCLPRENVPKAKIIGENSSCSNLVLSFLSGSGSSSQTSTQ